MFLSRTNQIPTNTKVLLDGSESKPIVFVANHAFFLLKYLYQVLPHGCEGKSIRKELIGASHLIADIVADITSNNDEK